MSPPRLVVSNTTPISNLIRIQQLPLPQTFFGRVVIPTQVAEELDGGKHVHKLWQDTLGGSVLVIEPPLDGPFLRQPRDDWTQERRQPSRWLWSGGVSAADR